MKVTENEDGIGPIRIMGWTSKESVALGKEREDSYNPTVFILGSVADL